MAARKTRVGVLLGDASGIGPEVAARVLAETSGSVFGQAEVAVLGDARVLNAGAATAGVSVATEVVDRAEDLRWGGEAIPVLDLPTTDPRDVTVGRVSAECGKAVLDTFTRALRLCQDGVVDGLCFAPLNKEAMRLGGSSYSDELHFVASVIGWTGLTRELNVLDDLWLSRVTSHVALKDVAALITTDRVLEAVRLVDGVLRKAGVSRPRVALAALNPHAGDGGLFGDEEPRVLEPAVEQARAEGIDAVGPFPSDTIFLRLKPEGFHAIVSMYHDQGQIAMKLLGFNRGVTVLGGLPIPIATPAHGTAHDIAGQGKADPGATRAALALCCRMAALG